MAQKVLLSVAQQLGIFVSFLCFHLSVVSAGHHDNILRVVLGMQSGNDGSGDCQEG